MRKFVLVLVAALATSAMAADPVITLVPGAANSGEVDIMYTADATDANLLPSGFGLNVQVDSGAIITQVKNYKQGVSVSGDLGYGIFPGQVVISGDPAAISDANTPVVGGTDVSGVTTNNDANVVLEMGALYDRDEENDRPVMGAATRLCTIVVDKTCNVTVTGDDDRCGDGKGIVAQNYTAYPIDADNTVVANVTISTGCACKGDVNKDGVISVLDMSAIVGFLSPAYAGTNPPYTAPGANAPDVCYDVNGDGVVSVLDMSAIVGFLSPTYAGTNPPYTTSNCMP